MTSAPTPAITQGPTVCRPAPTPGEVERFLPGDIAGALGVLINSAQKHGATVTTAFLDRCERMRLSLLAIAAMSPPDRSPIPPPTEEEIEEASRLFDRQVWQAIDKLVASHDDAWNRSRGVEMRAKVKDRTRAALTAFVNGRNGK